MVTINQILLKRQVRSGKKKKNCRTPSLRGCPHKKGIIISVVIVRPKKPNSARRHIARLRLSTGKKIRAAIPGG